MLSLSPQNVDAYAEALLRHHPVLIKGEPWRRMRFVSCSCLWVLASESPRRRPVAIHCSRAGAHHLPATLESLAQMVRIIDSLDFTVYKSCHHLWPHKV